MKLASCDNCAHRKSNACSLGMAPEAGEFYCPKYTMNSVFFQELLDHARKEFQKEVNQSMLEIAVSRAEKGKAFAG